MIKKYIPNILTLFRIFLVPVFIFQLLVIHDYFAALLVFTLASISDWADGYFARKFNVVSDFGAFFDPLADKFLVLSAFISFLYIESLSNIGSIELWMVIVIAFRDLSITILRIIINSKGNYKLITTNVAKIKTALQLISINFILLTLIVSNYFEFIYYLMIATTGITLYTGLHYYYNNAKQLSSILFNK